MYLRGHRSSKNHPWPLSANVDLAYSKGCFDAWGP